MPDVLVVSQSCLAAINRFAYRELARRGWSVEIVAPTRLVTPGFARGADARAADDPPMHFLPLRGTHPRLWVHEGLGPLLRKLRPRVVLLDVDPGSLLALQVAMAVRAFGARIACQTCDNMRRTVAGELRRSPGAGARAAAVKVLVALARSRVDHVFAISSDIEAVMQEAGFTGRVTRIPLGFDPATFFPNPEARRRVRQALGLTDVTIAYFGRLIPEKGVHLLLRALKRLEDRPWQLLLDRFAEYQHPYARDIARLTDELGLRDRVVFFDAGHDEIADYMNAADVVVAPSVSNPQWKEQYGRVVPEAMACGRVVIVSSCGALPELVGDAGLVVPENDIDALAQTLARALADPTLRESYGARAAERARRELSLVAQCDRMELQLRAWCAPGAASGRTARTPKARHNVLRARA